jgi:hypothetical protein
MRSIRSPAAAASISPFARPADPLTHLVAQGRARCVLQRAEVLDAQFLQGDVLRFAQRRERGEQVQCDCALLDCMGRIGMVGTGGDLLLAPPAHRHGSAVVPAGSPSRQ